MTISDELPTVRQVAIDPAIDPNTVSHGYREMGFAGLPEPQPVQVRSSLNRGRVLQERARADAGNWLANLFRAPMLRASRSSS
jgi:DNA-binding transcriptional regulator YhcF (GntR family)